ncbi:hypothetical protein [Clostridium botulinum]|uniref:Serine protease n=1 Tax=Clostridium botulinum TaxID=1491 RepID=A0A9Q1UWS2_CLOBO|nr:hypothetical protein [Clostridium botulinum]KEI02321.1 hypothetical protein Z953_07655 [Clostridium botulinum D str. 16868]KEI04554.1 hypothetical protein Y848_01080 [Clostridium botulinum C/D str. Sp77]KLU75124.1 hypothetical protein CBC3_10675 [Clostridium botulinum V891]KOA75097.1 hypothetical protein ADU78_09380 [Clostridium botulinum]KOA79768.1 hypothetical protein ADU77_03405 [Clostridium botulinum]
MNTKEQYKSDTPKTLADKILYICRYEYKYFLAKTNVIGVGLSYKIKNGTNTNKKCIRVFTTKKLSKDELSPQDLIPSLYKGIETDIVEDGFNINFSLKNKIRPITAGYSISPTQGLLDGTLGCLVKDAHAYYVLSNNHVLASCNDNPIGTPIVQPSLSFGGKYPADTVANLSKFVPLKIVTKTQTPENIVDCAIAKITSNSLFSRKVTFLGKIKGINHPVLDLSVQKVGSTSELTYGKITTLGASRLLKFTNNKYYLFKNQIITTKMGESGDSGSILFDTHMNAIGLLVSGGDSSTTYNPISTVLSSLNVSIVTS